MDLYDIPLIAIDGTSTTLAPYRGRMLLVVNVASRCGFTPQYQGLEALYRRRKDDLVVLGFPCNQFGRQEPDGEMQILSFCRSYFQVTFPLFAKIDVNGPQAHPLFRYLKSMKKGLLGYERVMWNFTKFLIGRDGAVLRRYAPATAPEHIERDIFGR